MAWKPLLAKLPCLAGQAKYIDISLLPFGEFAISCP